MTPTAARLKKGIPVYNREQLKGVTYKVVLPLKATSCKHLLWHPSVTEEDVAAQLRFQAGTARANGISNVTCSSKEGMSLTKNCWESITYNAIAIQVSPRFLSVGGECVSPVPGEMCYLCARFVPAAHRSWRSSGRPARICSPPPLSAGVIRT